MPCMHTTSYGICSFMMPPLKMSLWSSFAATGSVCTSQLLRCRYIHTFNRFLELRLGPPKLHFGLPEGGRIVEMVYEILKTYTVSIHKLRR